MTLSEHPAIVWNPKGKGPLSYLKHEYGTYCVFHTEAGYVSLEDPKVLSLYTPLVQLTFKIYRCVYLLNVNSSA
jgi:hypothetical protein